MKNIDLDDIRTVIQNSKTMAEAAKKLNIPFMTFKRRASEFGLYSPNQGRKGIKRENYEHERHRTKLDEILDGQHPNFARCHLKAKLLKNGIKENKCEICGISEWMGKEIICHLDHIDGNGKNNKLSNLRMICPNCHSQTDTYSGKNVKKKKADMA